MQIGDLTKAGWLTLLAALLLLGVTGTAYSLIVPAFETPDELYHYGFARHLAQGNPLPVQDVEKPGPWQQEGSQAPLYYMAVGWLTSMIDQNDFENGAEYAISQINDRSNIGDPLFPGNKNRMLYSALERPLTGTNLALHVGRWFSLLLGAITLIALYATGRLAFPEQPGVVLFALWTVAAIPQFAFISASVSNDNMIIAASAVTLFWLVRLAAKPVNRPIRLWEWLLLGCLLGVAALSKLQGLGLWLLAGLVGMLLAWRRHDWRLPLVALLPVAVPALAICGWWYWRNYTLYGDWLGVSHLLEINGQRASLPSWQELQGEVRGLRYSFWGLFGWFNILLPDLMYRILDAVTLLAVTGLPIGFMRRKQDPAASRAHAVLIGWAILSLALIVYWSSQATGSQGRLLFPGLTAFGLLFAWGLNGWWGLIRAEGRWRGRMAVVLGVLWPGLLLGSSLYALVVLLPGAYHAPTPVATVPESAQMIHVAYAHSLTAQEQIQLLALEIGDGRYRVGEQVPITLYLTTASPLHENYQLFIQLLDETGHTIANVTTHPGWGRNPTRLWTPGAIYADEYLVQVTGPIDDRAPLLARLYIGFIDPATNQTTRLPIDAFDEAGNEIEPMVGQVALSPWHGPELAALGLTDAAVIFHDQIQLRGYRVEAQVASGTTTLPVTLLWEAVGTPAADYVGYVHLLDAMGQQVAGFDQAPAGVRFPTRYWQRGDQIVSEFALALPSDLAAGPYQLWVGLYSAASQGAERLPVMDAGGFLSAHNQVKLTNIRSAE